MKRSLRYLLAAAPLLLCGLAEARDLPNVNVYYAAKPARVTAIKSTGSTGAHSAPPAAASSFDDRRGVPTFLWAARSTFITPPASVSISPEAAARGHLLSHAPRYGLSTAAL